MTPLAADVWMDTAPVRFLGLKLSVNMAVVRLPDAGLLLYSPLAMTAERRAAVEALGQVAHLYAPNLMHHLWIGEWAKAFPAARVHAPAQLGRKRRDLRVDRAHGSPAEPAFTGAVEEIAIEGFRLLETALFHGPSRTLLLADGVHNVGRPEHGWTRLYTRLMGFYDRVALSRALRWTAFSDRAAARRSIDRLLALPFDRLFVGHGAPLASGGREALEAAYRWLTPR